MNEYSIKIIGFVDDIVTKLLYDQDISNTNFLKKGLYKA